MMNKYKYRNKVTGEIIFTNTPVSDEAFELVKVLVKQKVWQSSKSTQQKQN